jgi:hypothetical protein
MAYRPDLGRGSDHRLLVIGRTGRDPSGPHRAAAEVHQLGQLLSN